MRHLFKGALKEELALPHNDHAASCSIDHELVATLSHEIRTSLYGLRGMIEQLKESGLTEDQARQVEMMDQSSSRLFGQLTDVLNYTRTESGELALNSTIFNPADLVDEVFQTFSAVAQQKKIELYYSEEIPLPRKVKGDVVKIKQVLQNLVSNAVKFTSSGQVVVSAAMKKDKYGCDPCLGYEVSDTGVGIGAEETKVLFEAYAHQEKNSRLNPDGMGLGLSIAKRFVDAMDGHIGIQPRPESEGALFYFWVPVKAFTELQVLPKAAAEAVTRRSLRILLVDDDPVSQYVTQNVLETAGHTVCIANDGLEAVRCYLRESFDLILMDVHMSEMDGLDATRMIRKIQHGGGFAPVIGLTAEEKSHIYDTCLQAGMDNVLSKPFGMDQLDAMVAQHMT
uniref:histidine kinase n=1 Tax=Magnetococcus massalia (strain MO-1) TaxID=451514 RepID=A0A1S7LC41_MAGMO|nr:putative Histidine kinase with HisKA, HATPase and Response regulator receiver domains [Candidatus Magnetococcus massalia]